VEEHVQVLQSPQIQLQRVVWGAAPRMSSLYPQTTLKIEDLNALEYTGSK
jgi:hypothetical protein